MEKLKQILNIAKKFQGVTSSTKSHHDIIDLYNSFRPLPRGYKMKYRDHWGACFVSVVMYLAGIENFPYECGVHEMQAELYKKDCLIRGRICYPGEIVFTKKTVGLCCASNEFDGYLDTIEVKDKKQISIVHHNLNDADIWCLSSPWQYSLKEVATQVLSGWYLDGMNRERMLTQNGYDPKSVQAIINRMRKSNDEA